MLICLNFTRDKAKSCLRDAEIRENPPNVGAGSQKDEDKDGGEYAEETGYDPTMIQKTQIKWLRDIVAMGRNPETRR